MMDKIEIKITIEGRFEESRNVVLREIKKVHLFITSSKKEITEMLNKKKELIREAAKYHLGVEEFDNIEVRIE